MNELLKVTALLNKMFADPIQLIGNPDDTSSSEMGFGNNKLEKLPGIASDSTDDGRRAVLLYYPFLSDGRSADRN